VREKIALLRNVALVGVAGYVETAIGLAAGVMIARTLGPADYGHYAFAIWLCGMLMMAGNHALPTSAMKFLAEARGANRSDVAAALAHRFLRLQFASSGIVLALFALAMLLRPLSDWQDSLPLMLGVAVVAVWARAAFWMRSGIGKGYENFVPESVALGITALLNLVLVSLLAWRGASVAQFFIVYAALGLVSNALVRVMLPRCGIRPKAGPIPEELQLQLRRHLLLTGILMLLGLGTAKIVEMTLLKIHAGAEAVGYFAIAGSLTKGAVDLLIGGLSAVLLPAMSRRYGTGGLNSLGRMFTEATRLYWFIGLAVAGLGATVSGDLVHLLYGPRYDGAIPALTWHLVITGLVLISGPATAVLTASDRQSDRIRVVVYSFGVNLAIGLLLIPRYGLNGAIASFGTTVIYQAALSFRYARRRTAAQMSWGAMARLGIAAALATILSYLTTLAWDSSAAFLTGTVVFVAVYVPLSLMLRTWRAVDIEVIANILARRGGIGSRLSRHVISLQRYAMSD
jgi:O-antigen/teichoic acid export membrane protein